MSYLYKKTAAELSKMIKQKEVKPSEICESFIFRYNEVDKDLFSILDADAALSKAKELDNVAIGADTPAMHGLPVAIKDNICTKDMPTTCSSLMLKDFCPPYDATVITKLKDTGAVIFGKLNMDEFAMGSGAAVASGSALFALGSDTGGSANCGMVGYKPSYGAVSRFGCVPYAASLDQVGPIARSVLDAAILTTAIAGHDPMDARSNPNFNFNFSDIENTDIKGKKIGFISEYGGEIENVKKKFIELGAIVEDVSIPIIKYSQTIHCNIAFAEASSNFARLDGIRYGHRSEDISNMDELYVNSRSEGFGSEVRRIIWLGTHILSAEKYSEYYEKACKARELLRMELKRVLGKYDVLLTMCTAPANLAGLPAVAMPIGFQLIGRRFDDAALLGVAHAFERGGECK